MIYVKVQFLVWNFLLFSIAVSQFNEKTFYQACGKSAGVLCFGMNKLDPQEDCVFAKNCDLVVSAFEDPLHKEKVRFQLMGKPPKNSDGNFMGSYIAVGLSDDNRMGQDSVIECVSSGSKTRLYTSWNTFKGNTRQDDKSYISNEWVSYKDNKLYCDFTRNIKSVVEKTTFDLKYDPGFHILLAMGNLENSQSEKNTYTISYHDLRNRVASQQQILNRKTIVKYAPPRISVAQRLKISVLFLFIGFSVVLNL